MRAVLTEVGQIAIPPSEAWRGFAIGGAIAVAGGVAAVVVGAVTAGAARKEPLQRGLAFAAALAAIALGAYQLARGFGVFGSAHDFGS